MTKLIPGKLYKTRIEPVNAYDITNNSDTPSCLRLRKSDVFTFLYKKEMCRFRQKPQIHYVMLYGAKIYTFCYYDEPNQKFENITTQVL